MLASSFTSSLTGRTPVEASFSSVESSDLSFLLAPPASPLKPVIAASFPSPKITILASFSVILKPCDQCRHRVTFQPHTCPRASALSSFYSCSLFYFVIFSVASPLSSLVPATYFSGLLHSSVFSSYPFGISFEDAPPRADGRCFKGDRFCFRSLS